MSQEQQNTIESEIEYLAAIRPELAITVAAGPHVCESDRTDVGRVLTVHLGRHEVKTCFHDDYQPARVMDSLLSVVDQAALECHAQTCGIEKDSLEPSAAS